MSQQLRVREKRARGRRYQRRMAERRAWAKQAAARRAKAAPPAKQAKNSLPSLRQARYSRDLQEVECPHCYSYQVCTYAGVKRCQDCGRDFEAI